MHIFVDLQRREAAAGPVRVAVIGTGFFGSGLIRRLATIRGLTPAVAANRTLERAVAALEAAGIDRARIRICDDPDLAQRALEDGLHVATSRLDLPACIPAVDVVMECTGDVLVGAEVALTAIRGGKHIVAANPETQATVGPILKRMADAAGVVYSDVDGDQPGILKNLYDYCAGLGFTPVVAGNCKGVLKRYATPETQTAFAEAHGIKPWIACAAADGTKLSVEMAIVANATGMPPAMQGMAGIETTLETALADLDRHGLLSRGPIVEYTLGIPSGVFLVARSEDPAVAYDFRYLKMGDGPNYLFYRPYVLVYYEAPLSAAEAALYGTATITPAGAPVADVATFAKRDLRAGRRLDGIGGFDCYGLIVGAEEAHAARMLPIGLAGFTRLTRDIGRDEPITYDAVEFEESNAVIDLRRQQDAQDALVSSAIQGPGSR
jgi:predicted homoserine dehydrogenase-like protein